MSSFEVARVSGVSYRQLDYWARTGLIEGQEDTPGTGNYRRWTPAQLRRVKQLARAARLKSLPLSELADRLSV